MAHANISYTAIDGQSWKTAIETNNSENLRYFIISWAGWHPTSLLTLHKMSYKYGLDIGEDATDTRQRVQKFVEDLWERPKHGDFANYWWDDTCWANCPSIDMVSLATTYLHAATTFAILDVRDSLCLQDYLVVGLAAHAFNQGPTGTRTPTELLHDLETVLNRSAGYDYRPKTKHSFWTRGWLAQEQLYSKDLVYVHQVNVADQRIETTLQDCEVSQRAIQEALARVRQLPSPPSHIGLLERYANLGKTITLRRVPGTTPWELYCNAAAVLPKEARDSRTLVSVLRNIWMDLPPELAGQDNANADETNTELALSIQPMVKAALSAGYTPVPRLWKARGDPLALRGRSWCYNAVLEMESDEHQQFITTDCLFGLGRLGAGVTVQFMASGHLQINAPCCDVILPAGLARTWPQTGDTLAELAANSPRPILAKTGIVLANHVSANVTDFGAIAISDKFCWLTDLEYKEVWGYVDVAFLKANLPPPFQEPGTDGAWLSTDRFLF